MFELRCSKFEFGCSESAGQPCASSDVYTETSSMPGRLLSFQFFPGLCPDPGQGLWRITIMPYAFTFVRSDSRQSNKSLRNCIDHLGIHSPYRTPGKVGTKFQAPSCRNLRVQNVFPGHICISQNLDSLQ